MTSILLVQHADTAVAEEVQGILAHAGYATEVSATAVAYAYTQSMQPDLILFLGLTDLDVRVLDLLRADAGTAATPVLVCTEDAEDPLRLLPAHTTILPLPVVPVTLLAAVAAALQGEAPDRR